MDKNYRNIDELNKSSLEKAIESGYVQKGDKVVLVSGLVAGQRGSNFMMIKTL